MPTYANTVRAEIKRLVGILVEIGLSDDQNSPFIVDDGGGLNRIEHNGYDQISADILDWPYDDLYQYCREGRIYCVKFLDGSIIQLSYKFRRRSILTHRLAFLPSPNLEDYERDPDSYNIEQIFSEMHLPSAVVTPIRFDFDRAAFVENSHPMSHATLGQHRSCRIAVTAPVSPFRFIEFVLRAFYFSAFMEHTDKIGKMSFKFDETITTLERSGIHFAMNAGT